MNPTIPMSAVGVAVGPIVATVDPRWLMAYAAGVGETDPRYFDTTAPAGLAVHPMFLVGVEWAPLVAIRAKVLPDGVTAHGLHATHHLRRYRAPRAGERLRTTARVTAVEPRRSGVLLTVTLETMDAANAPVATTRYGSMFRGVLPPDTGIPGDREPARPKQTVGTVRWDDEVPVAATAAHVYSACSRIWNPIHTDVAVARAARLPGVILHGTATLALAVSRVIARDADGEPSLVRMVSARFTRMVPLPTLLRVRGGGQAGALVAFDVVGGDGRPVVADGVVELGAEPGP